MEEHTVTIYIYDISKGLARAMSPLLLGKQLDGIWHTAVVIYGQEFFFGGEGIQSSDPGTTILNQPDKIEHLGNTQIPYDMFMDYIHELSTSTFRPETYHVLNHNCNTFTNEVAQFLTGSSIPSYITDLPQEFLNTPLGAMVRPYLDAMTVSPSGGSSVTGQRRVTNSASVNRGKAKATSEQHGNLGTTSVQPQVRDTTQTSEAGRQDNVQNESDDSPTEPQVYKQVTIAQKEYADVKDRLKSLLNSKDVRLLDEMSEYIATEEPTWGLGPDHVAVIYSILNGSDCTETEKEAVCGLLQECLYHVDVIMMLKHDPNNTYTRMLTSFEQHSLRIKEKLAKGLCNCSSCEEGLLWLMKEDEAPNNGIGSVALNVCRCCLLDQEAVLNDVGAALAQSVTRKQVSTELAVDLGCALVELLQKDTATETAKSGILALCQCIKSNIEVAAVAVVSGLNPDDLAQKHPSLKHLCTNYLKSRLTVA